MSETEEPKKKEHWTRHPAFLVILPLVIANFGAIVAAIKFATVEHIPLFILIWLLGMALTFIAGLAWPFYILIALISKDMRKEGYFRFLLRVYWGTPAMIYYMIRESMTKREKVSSKSQEESIQQIMEQAKKR